MTKITRNLVVLKMILLTTLGGLTNMSNVKRMNGGERGKGWSQDLPTFIGSIVFIYMISFLPFTGTVLQQQSIQL